MWDGTDAHEARLAAQRISIHPSRVGWDAGLADEVIGDEISIHPSRVGWDHLWNTLAGIGVISIHPSRVGWDLHDGQYISRATSFQSTHPVWDGT